MRSEIEIINASGPSFPKEFFQNIVRAALESEKQKNAVLCLVLVKSGKIKELNLKYRHKDSPTDVLAFPASALKLKGGRRKKEEISELNQIEGLGDIVVCPEIIRKNAENAKVPFRQELARCVIHGILHLIGYSHEKSPKMADIMRRRENHILKKFGFICKN